MPTTPTTPNWSAIRQDFPILNQQVHGKPLIYLDNGATTQKPRQVIKALTDYYEKRQTAMCTAAFMN